VKEHLFLLLSRKGMGEAILGVRLARSLMAAGEKVSFICHESNDSLIPPGLPITVVKSELGSILPLYVQLTRSTSDFASIVLGDYLTTTLFFELEGLSPQAFGKPNIPIVAIDTWHSEANGAQIDVFTDGNRSALLWPDLVKCVCPVPFLVPRGASTFYQDLPEAVKLPTKVKKHVRSAIGLPEGSRAVLFCTAGWQHAEYESEAGIRLSRTVPELLGHYVSRMGKDVHLVHVGPKPYELGELLDNRYHWIPPLPPERFDNVIASVDLLLSANISATTITKAMVYGVPTMVIENAQSVSTREQAEALLGSPASSFLQGWLEKNVPLFPFSLWPLGYYRFLQPLLRDNPYRAALDVVPLLEEVQVENTLSTLLFDQTRRDGQLHRQAQYLQFVRTLPTGAEAVHQLIGK
jgi:hypothetical protein